MDILYVPKLLFARGDGNGAAGQSSRDFGFGLDQSRRDDGCFFAGKAPDNLVNNTGHYLDEVGFCLSDHITDTAESLRIHGKIPLHRKHPQLSGAGQSRAGHFCTG